MGTTGVRIWEVIVLGSVIFDIWFWVRYMRTKFTLGLYLGFTLCFGWTWLLDTPFLLNLQFHPASIDGWTWYGKWEPLWTAFSYSAVAIFVMLYLKYLDQLKSKLGGFRIPLIIVVATIVITIYEGWLGIGILGVERYNWKPEYLFLNLPITNIVVLVPIIFAVSLLLAEAFEKLLRKAGEVTMLGAGSRSSFALGSGSWTSFMLGFAVPQVAIYMAYVGLSIVVNQMDPWTSGVPFQNLW